MGVGVGDVKAWIIVVELGHRKISCNQWSGHGWLKVGRGKTRRCSMCRCSQMISGPLWLWRLDLEPGRNIPFLCCAVTSWPRQLCFKGSFRQAAGCKVTAVGSLGLKKHTSAVRTCQKTAPLTRAHNSSLLGEHYLLLTSNKRTGVDVRIQAQSWRSVTVNIPGPGACKKNKIQHLMYSMHSTHRHVTEPLFYLHI